MGELIVGFVGLNNHPNIKNGEIRTIRGQAMIYHAISGWTPLKSTKSKINFKNIFKSLKR